jgi:K+ transporter
VTVVAIVIAFGSATALANAYGVAVTGTFFLTRSSSSPSHGCSGTSPGG